MGISYRLLQRIEEKKTGGAPNLMLQYEATLLLMDLRKTFPDLEEKEVLMQLFVVLLNRLDQLKRAGW